MCTWQGTNSLTYLWMCFRLPGNTSLSSPYCFHWYVLVPVKYILSIMYLSLFFVINIHSHDRALTLLRCFDRCASPSCIRLFELILVGKPIRLEQNKNPTPAEVEEVQRRYIAELTQSVHIFFIILTMLLTLFPSSPSSLFCTQSSLAFFLWFHSVWDTYKDVYAPHRKRELTLVD